MCSECTLVIDEDGDNVFRDVEGRLHCHDGPAVMWPNGHVEYYCHGLRHRDGDLPAVIYPNGGVSYYKNGERHRDGDMPAAISPIDGAIEYWVNGLLHRVRRPAVICTNGDVEYWENGVLLRREYVPR